MEQAARVESTIQSWLPFSGKSASGFCYDRCGVGALFDGHDFSESVAHQAVAQMDRMEQPGTFASSESFIRAIPAGAKRSPRDQSVIRSCANASLGELAVSIDHSMMFGEHGQLTYHVGTKGQDNKIT